MKTADVIKHVREKLGLTKRAFGKYCSVTGQYIDQLESGGRSPSLKVAQNIQEFAEANAIKIGIEHEKKFKSLYIA